MGHLEGNFTPVLYRGRKAPKGLFVYNATLRLSKCGVLSMYNYATDIMRAADTETNINAT
jgi:hypothetical protein